MEMIWKKIDGLLSDQESAEFDKMLKDAEFKAMYKKQLNVNKLLSKVPLHYAPDVISENVMASIARKVSYNYAFSGIRKIGYMMTAASVVAFVIANIIENNGASGESQSIINQYLPNLELAMPSFDAFSSYVPYLLALFALTSLVWLDGVLKTQFNKVKA